MIDVASLAIKVENEQADAAARSLDNLSDAGARAERATDGVNVGASRMVATFAAATAAAGFLVSRLGDAAAAAGRLQSSVQSAASMAGFGKVQLVALQNAARDLSAGTVFSAEQIGAAFADIAADAGGLAKTPDQLRGLTESVIELATATRSQLPEAGQALLQVMRQFEGVSADQVVDMIAGLGATAGEMQETTQALAAAGPVARALGVDLRETAGAISVLADAGIEGSEAGSGLGLVMRQLDQETDQRLRPSVVGLEAALRSAAAAQYEFEGRSLAVGVELARNADAIGRVGTELQNSDAGARLAAEALGTYEGQAARLDATLSTLKTTIGDSLLPAMTSAATATTDLVLAMNSLADIENTLDGETADVSAFDVAVRGAGLGLVGLQGMVQNVDLHVSALAERFLVAFDFTQDAEEARKSLRNINTELERQLELLDKRQGKAFDTVLYGPEKQAPLESRGPTTRRYELGSEVLSPPSVRTEEPQTVTKPAAAPRVPEVDTLAAPRFLAEAAEDSTDDPTEKLRVRFQLELQAYAEQGRKLVQVGAITEEQRATAIAQRWRANEQNLLAQQQEAAVQRQATLMNLNAELAVDEFESERQRVDARLLLLQDGLAREIGDVGEAMRIVEDLRTKGYGEIQKKQQEDAKVQQYLALREKQDRLRIASETATGLVLLAGGSSKKLMAIEKATAIASALMNVPLAASRAYAWGTSVAGPIGGAAAAAVAVAAQLGYVSAIASGGGSGGGGGGGSLNVGAPAYAGPEKRGPLYEEEGDGPTIETLKRSDRIEREQFASADPAAPHPVEGGSLVINEPEWSLPALSVNTPEVTKPESRKQPASLRVERPGDLRVAMPQVPQLALANPTLKAPDDLTLQAPRMATASVARAPERVSANRLSEKAANVTQLVTATSSLVERVERQERTRTVERTRETLAAAGGTQVQPGETLSGGTATAAEVPSLKFNAPTLELSEPTWSIPALEINTPNVSVAPAGGGGSGRGVNLRIEIINQAGVKVQAQASEPGLDGEQLVQIVISTTASDVDQNGPLSQAIARRFGLQQQLAYRG